MSIIPLLKISDSGRKPQIAIFLSGSGSNAEQVLEYHRQAGSQAPFQPAVLVTDAPNSSRAGEIGRNFGIPVVANDIRLFYQARGEARVTLATPGGRRLREEWTDALRRQLAEHAIDFGVLAGFVPLCNITADYPCLNVHPGDLTCLKDGKRYLVGLHTIPIERALLDGLDELRSSVIQALPYTGSGEDMDNGPLLGISEAVPVDLAGANLEDLQACAASRPALRPPGGYKDRLEEIAKLNQENLKKAGDWIVLPRTVAAFARGSYGRDETGRLHFLVSGKWHPVETVVFGKTTREILFRTESGE